MRALVLILSLLSTFHTYAFEKEFFLNPLNAGFPRELQGKLTNKDQIFLIIRLPQIKKRQLSTLSFEDIDFGHVQMAWSCQIKKKWFRSAIGFSNKNDKRLKELFKHKKYYQALKLKDKNILLEGPFLVNKALKEAHVIELNPQGKCNRIIKNIWNFINKKNKSFSLAPDDNDSNSYNCVSTVVELLSPLNLIKKELIYKRSALIGRYLTPKDLYNTLSTKRVTKSPPSKHIILN